MFSANTSQVSNDVKYIEDFFSAWLRTGTGSSQTVTTGIKENTGALVISKSRSAATDWAWYDTFRGATKDLVSNSTAAETTQSQGLTAFNTDGHTWGTLAKVNTSGATYVDFVLKPTPKFFDVVTWSGNDTYRNITHSLGSVPGCIIIKTTNTTGGWRVYHRSLGQSFGADNLIYLNTTAASVAGGWGGYLNPTSTTFSVGPFSGQNATGETYVAYLFAHNAGGFGLTGTDNVISCGSYTGNGSATGPVVTLGYEPQWLLVKRASGGTANWYLMDSMRGFTASGSDQALYPNLSDFEYTSQLCGPTATGFQVLNSSPVLNNSGDTYIYIAIRRGPMKTPTSGASVFAAQATAGATDGTASANRYTSNFPVDVVMQGYRAGSASNSLWLDRLRGGFPYLVTSSTAAETNSATEYGFDDMDGVYMKTTLGASSSFCGWMLRRAPGFFDEVCYTGDGVGVGIKHNLGVPPELIIQKVRSANQGWNVYVPSSITGGGNTCQLNTTLAFFTSSNVTNVTSTQYDTAWASSGQTYVNYLFASCPGVSKVGSYTGTGAAQTINCGFTAGARFVLIKRTDSTGDWHVWDTARGIVSANDPRLSLNSTAAEVTTDDSIDPDNSGFIVNQVAATNINVSSATYIYLAIA